MTTDFPSIVHLLPRTAPAGLTVFACVIVLFGTISLAQEQEPRLPQGNNGIAAQFPGDRGIEQHPSVVFVETFDGENLQEVFGRWETVLEEAKMSFSDEAAPGSASSRSLLMHRETGRGPQLYRRIANRDGGWGYDQLYFRYYVKIAPDAGYLHHGVSAMGGNQPATRYPQVSAGNRPDGNRSFWSGIEPMGERWTWDYYTYWVDMRGSPPAGRTWGNTFIRNPELTVNRGQWICIEHMIKINDMGETNGEQALWIDGELVSHLGKGFPNGVWVYDQFRPSRGGRGHRWTETGPEPFEVPEGGLPFEGFRWRTHPDLNVNFIWLYVYRTDPADQKVWYDQVVVATEYIGPITPSNAAE